MFVVEVGIGHSAAPPNLLEDCSLERDDTKWMLFVCFVNDL